MFNAIQAPQYEFVEYVLLDNIVKNQKISYNTCKENTGDNMLNGKEKDLFIPSKEGMEQAKKRFEERIKKGTTKGYAKYFDKLMKSYNDVRIND